MDISFRINSFPDYSGIYVLGIALLDKNGLRILLCLKTVLTYSSKCLKVFNWTE